MSRILLLAVLSVATGACGDDLPGVFGGGDSDDSAADAGPTPLDTCEDRGLDDIEEMSLAIGLSDGEGGFNELVDGDECPFVRGSQGLFMILLQARAMPPTTAAEICLDCDMVVSPAGSFSGVDQNASLTFSESERGDMLAFATIILGDLDLQDDLEGAAVSLTIDCAGHGLAARVVREAELYLLGE